MVRKRSEPKIPTLHEVVDRAHVAAMSRDKNARLPNLDLFADPAAGIPDPNALQQELATQLTRRVEEFARQAAREMERKLIDRLHHELPGIVEQTLRDHFNRKG